MSLQNRSKAIDFSFFTTGVQLSLENQPPQITMGADYTGWSNVDIEIRGRAIELIIFGPVTQPYMQFSGESFPELYVRMPVGEFKYTKEIILGAAQSVLSHHNLS